MPREEVSKSRRVFLDFAAGRPSTRLDVEGQMRIDGVTLARIALRPNPGIQMGVRQLCIVLNVGEPYQMDWRSPVSDKRRSRTIETGALHIVDEGHPFWQRWDAHPTIFVFALDTLLIERAWEEAFDGKGSRDIGVTINAHEPVVRRFCELAKAEFEDPLGSEKLYVESLAMALAVHLLRTRAQVGNLRSLHRGGLPPSRMKRVLDFVMAHLRDDFGTEDMAQVAGLSRHHFGAAFRQTIGVPPHRYVMELRTIEAERLLREGRLSIAEIADVSGFSSQSHLTLHFRRLRGVTPAKFRDHNR